MKIPALRLFSTLLACGLMWSLASCSPGYKSTSSTPVVSGLTVAQATLEQAPDDAAAVGTVHARESVSLAAQTMGRVEAVLVREGDTVRAGQLLVRLDGTVSQAELERARAGESESEHELAVAQSQANLAASTLARYKILRDQKSVSPQEYDEMDHHAQAAAAQLEAEKAQVQSAHAAVSASRTTAGYAAIVAPFAGVVAGRHVDPGAMAMPGTPLVDVDRMGQLQLEVSVDESRLSSVRLGALIAVAIPSLDAKSVPGRVAQIVPVADAASHSFLVKIDLAAEKDLRAGMYGSATLAGSKRMAVMAAQSAVVTHGSLHSVWVLDQCGIASLRYVTLGNASGDKVEVLSGLNKGEQIVLSPGDRELGGARIEARP
ncbi:MAG TPA: efflux RND transporter periplasmic adaptor subunit [Terracidiphilus sp.]|nr:efflux RND transporter periplasmic adaptor subunit [Terracidiphilus sp.]